jgi:hypothetical protein
MLLALIILTSLDGSHVWVESTAVQIIRRHTQECKHGHGSVIRVTGAALCVRETPEQIKEKIERAK